MNTWEFIQDALPYIGSALGGPLGGAAASFLGGHIGLPTATVDTIKTVLSGMSPENVLALKNADNEFQLKLATLGYDNIAKLNALNASVVSDVNKTMQVEAISEHWPTYAWRPFIGFMFGSYVASMWILPLFGKVPVVLSPDLTLAIGGILGIASYFRGKAQADPQVQSPTNVTQKG